jgi:hypothetical protein
MSSKVAKSVKSPAISIINVPTFFIPVRFFLPSPSADLSAAALNVENGREFSLNLIRYVTLAHFSDSL